MPGEENPVDEFRRVTAAAMRAIAERDDITVTFGSEARLVGTQALSLIHISEPTRPY